MISAQLRDALLAEARPRHAIDAEWIKGIRKSWKLALAKAKKYPGRFEKATDFDFDKIFRSADGAASALSELISYVRALRADLLVNKGFWTTKEATRGKPWDIDALRAKVVINLDKAEDAASEARRRVLFWKNTLTPGTGEYQMDGGQRRSEAQASIAGFQLYVNSVFLSVEEGADLADKAINRTLDNLRDAMKKIPNTFPLIGELGGGEPDVLRLGKVTVVFADSPSADERPMRRTFDHLGPSVATPHPLPMGVGGSMPGHQPRHPAFRRDYVSQLQQAEALLRRRGLGFLWYGNITIMCRECGGPNSYGKQFDTGGHYHRKGDYITIYNDPTRNLYRLIAHEMGHRYYYKFMSNQDRANFDKFFSGPPHVDLQGRVTTSRADRVRATSEYGGMATEEDFAEVFKDYIDGKGLDRGQAERLRQFLKGDRKLEWRESP